jgi:hypothetical protein
MTEPPFLDEHATTIAADVADVWPALVEVVGRELSHRGMSTYARLIRSDDWTASGPRPLAEGSTMPGFRVIRAVPGSELALAGRHRFSSYTLTFRLDQVGPSRSRLRAESRAAFPGVTSRGYRLLVVGSRGHAFAVRRMLANVRRRAERSPL